MPEEAGELQPVPTRTNEETAGEPARRDMGLQRAEPGNGMLPLAPPCENLAESKAPYTL